MSCKACKNSRIGYGAEIACRRLKRAQWYDLEPGAWRKNVVKELAAQSRRMRAHAELFAQYAQFAREDA